MKPVCGELTERASGLVQYQLRAPQNVHKPDTFSKTPIQSWLCSTFVTRCSLLPSNVRCISVIRTLLHLFTSSLRYRLYSPAVSNLTGEFASPLFLYIFELIKNVLRGQFNWIVNLSKAWSAIKTKVYGRWNNIQYIKWNIAYTRSMVILIMIWIISVAITFIGQLNVIFMAIKAWSFSETGCLSN